jgi:hypothetical protein
MNRIVVVQPHRMLQQAFAVALLPEHEVRVVENIPAAEALAAADLLIIDAAALRHGDTLWTHEVSAIQSCHVPVVWIDAEPPPVAFAKMVRLTPPLKRDELRSAAAEGLRLAASLPAAIPKQGRTVAAKTKGIEPKPENARSENAKPIIELVDVFEETPRSDESNADAGDKD